MKDFIRILLTIFAITSGVAFFPFEGFSQSMKHFSYGTTGNEKGNAVLSAGGGRILIGGSLQNSDNTIDAYLLCVNYDGDKVWENTYNFKGAEEITSLVMADDGDIYAIGNATEGSNTDIFIIKMTVDGQTVLTRYIDNDKVDRVGNNCAIATSDNGIIVVGMTGPDKARTDSYFAKFDDLGTNVWRRVIAFSTNGPDQCNAITYGSKDNFFIVGSLKGENSDPQDAYFMEITKDGNYVLSRRYYRSTDAFSENFSDILTNNDGSLIITGTVNDGVSDNLFIYKIDQIGTPYDNFNLLRFSYSSENEISARVTEVSGNFLLYCNSDGAGQGTQSIIIKVNDIGGFETGSSHAIGGNLTDEIFGIITEIGKQFIIGRTNSYSDNGDFDIFLTIADIDIPAGLNGSCMDMGPGGLTASAIPKFDASLLGNIVPTTPQDPGTTTSINANSAGTLAENICCKSFKVDVSILNGCVNSVTRFNIINPTQEPNYQYTWDFDEDGTIDATTPGSLERKFASAGDYSVKIIGTNISSGCVDSVTLSFQIQDGPFLDGLPSDTVICGNGNFNFPNIKILENYTYFWAPLMELSDPTDPHSMFNLFPGVFNYKLIATDAISGCSIEKNVNITINKPPITDVSPDVTVCSGQSTQLFATGGSNFRWEPAQFLDNPTSPNPIATVVKDTRFYVTIYEFEGCSSIDSIDVFTTKVNIGNDTILCSNSNEKIELRLTAAIKGVSGCTYRWLSAYNIINGNINSPSILVSPDKDTCYIVQANCDDCSSKDTICVKIKKGLPIEIEGAKTICQGDTAHLKVKNGLEFHWEPEESISNPRSPNPLVYPNFTTIYTVYVTDLSGCITSAEVEVTVNNLPFSKLPPDTAICSGGSIQLIAGASEQNITYKWYPQTGFEPGTEILADPIIRPQFPTTYFVRVENIVNGCFHLDSIHIDIKPKPTMNFVAEKEICLGNSTWIRAYNASGYYWINYQDGIFADSIFVSPKEKTTYYVIPIDGDCIGDTFSITIDVTSPPVASMISGNEICTFQELNVTYDQPIRSGDIPLWIWDGGEAEVVNGGSSVWGPFQVKFLNAGTHEIKLIVTASNGCTDTAKKTIQVKNSPLVNAGTDAVICKGESKLLDASYRSEGNSLPNFSWSPPTGLNNRTILNPTATPLRTTIYTLSANYNGCDSPLDSIKIDVIERPYVFLDTAIVSFCSGSGGVVLNAKIEGGDEKLIYEWFPKSGLNDFSILNPKANPDKNTEYKLIVTNPQGCESDTVRVFVRIDPIPVLDAGEDKFICDNQTKGVKLNGKPVTIEGNSYQYEWSPRDGLADYRDPNTWASPKKTTIYKLLAVNSKTGCSSDPSTLDTLSTVVVNVVLTPIADAGEDSIYVCLNEKVQIGRVPSGPGDDFIYRWEPDSGLSNSQINQPLASPGHTTTYFMYVKSKDIGNNGLECETMDKITVVVTPRPVIKIREIEMNCEKDSVQFMVTVGHPSDEFEVEWTPSEGLSNPNILEPKAAPLVSTYYKLTLKSRGCNATNIDSVFVRVVPLPTLEMNPKNNPLTICPNGPDSLYMPVKIKSGIAPFEYNWQPSEGLSNPRELNTGAKPLKTTTYTLTVRSSRCIVSDTVTIHVLPFVDASIKADTTTICMNHTTRLKLKGGIGDATYRWEYHNSSKKLITLYSDSLIYRSDTSVWVKGIASEGGCTDIDSIFIKVIPQPQANIQIGVLYGCNSLEVAFNQDSKYSDSWTWNFGDGSPIVNDPNPIHIYRQKGRYRVELKVAAKGGCRDSSISNIEIVVGDVSTASFTSSPLPGIIYIPNTEVEFKDQSTGPVSWLWNFGDGKYSSEQNPTHIFAIPGIYDVSLTIKDSIGCTKNYSLGSYIIKDRKLKIPNIFTPNNDGVNDIWAPEYKGSENYEATIYDRNGIEIYKFKNGEDGWNGNTKQSNTGNEGVYFYHLKVGDKIYKGSITLLR